MTTPRYTPHAQLDMFTPVQLGMGIDPQPLRHLTQAEADTLSAVITRRLSADYPGWTALDIDLALEPYRLDYESRVTVSLTIFDSPLNCENEKG